MILQVAFLRSEIGPKTEPFETSKAENWSNLFRTLPKRSKVPCTMYMDPVLDTERLNLNTRSNTRTGDRGCGEGAKGMCMTKF